LGGGVGSRLLEKFLFECLESLSGDEFCEPLFKLLLKEE
jgi:hypothetical protein